MPKLQTGGGAAAQDWDDGKLGGGVTEGNYYFAADDAEELENAFSTIADNVSTSKVAAGANTVLSDTLSEFFTFPEGLTGSSDGGMVQYAEVKGQDADGSYTWYEPETAYRRYPCGKCRQQDHHCEGL